MGPELRKVADTIMSDLGMGEDQDKIDALEQYLEENLSIFFSKTPIPASRRIGVTIDFETMKKVAVMFTRREHGVLSVCVPEVHSARYRGRGR